jgi:hypothetical protein
MIKGKTALIFKMVRIKLTIINKRRHLMKHITTIILVTVCLLAIGSWTYAQNRGRGYGRGAGNGPVASDTGRGMGFVDNDGDGVCDNPGMRRGGGSGYRFRAKGTTGNESKLGPNYVDKDGDGVCDNFPKNQDKAE